MTIDAMQDRNRKMLNVLSYAALFYFAWVWEISMVSTNNNIKICQTIISSPYYDTKF
jgi:hypothetical protein